MVELPPVDVSVVICVRNGAKVLRKQLDALAGQLDAPTFEVVIADNGSTDGTRGVIDSWASEGLGAIRCVRVVDGGREPSIPRARNRGALATRGRLIAYCDADDIVRPGWLKALSDGVTTGLAGGRVFVQLPDGTPKPEWAPNGLAQTEYLPHIQTNNAIFAREAFFAIGGFDESLPPYGCEDLEISWRAQEMGFPIDYVHGAEIDYVVTPPSGRRVAKEFGMEKARMAAWARHPGSAPAAYSLRSCLLDLLRHVVRLPLRLLRPAGVPRTRAVRWIVMSAGRLAGYWTYRVVGKEPRLLGGVADELAASGVTK